jgi:hypothetical protein
MRVKAGTVAVMKDHQGRWTGRRARGLLGLERTGLRFGLVCHCSSHPHLKDIKFLIPTSRQLPTKPGRPEILNAAALFLPSATHQAPFARANRTYLCRLRCDNAAGGFQAPGGFTPFHQQHRWTTRDKTGARPLLRSLHQKPTTTRPARTMRAAAGQMSGPSRVRRVNARAAQINPARRAVR